MLLNGSNTRTASRLQTCRQTTHKRLRELFDGIISTSISSIYTRTRTVTRSTIVGTSKTVGAEVCSCSSSATTSSLALLAVARCSLTVLRRHCSLTVLHRRCSVVLLRDEKYVAAQKQRGCKSSITFSGYSNAAAVINRIRRRRRECSTLSRLQQDFVAVPN